MDNYVTLATFFLGVASVWIGYVFGRMSKEPNPKVEERLNHIDMNTQAGIGMMFQKLNEINNKLDQTFIFKKKEDPKKKK